MTVIERSYGEGVTYPPRLADAPLEQFVCSTPAGQLSTSAAIWIVRPIMFGAGVPEGPGAPAHA